MIDRRLATSPLNRPLTSYYLIIGCSGLLLVIGLVMVLSTSSAFELDIGGSPYGIFVKQVAGALAGLALMWLLSRTPPRVFRAMAYPAMLAAIVSLLVVLAIGTSVNGSERWVRVAGVPLQPSEFAKLAFLLWGADLLARRAKSGRNGDSRMLLMPLLPGAAVIAMLVALGHDIGTTFVLLVILLALLWVSGIPARLFVLLLGALVFALLLLVITTRYADSRLALYLSQGGSPVGPDMQKIQGLRAIASGGLFGVGLGNSPLKWGWVPEATNDFIFAILGEELGLVGTLCVVLLFGGLAYAGLRVARRVGDPFMRLAAAATTAWIVTQALVNIGAVIGLLPITGVPLPLISAGLSSLLSTMAAIGMLLSFARLEPEAAAALAAAGPGPIRRLLGRAAPQPGPVPRPAAAPVRQRPAEGNLGGRRPVRSGTGAAERERLERT